MKKIILLFIIFSIIFSSFIYAKDDNKITKTIDNKEVTFNIPEDYNTLKKYYITLIDTYSSAENEVISIKKESNDYITFSKDTISKYDDLVKSQTDMINNKEKTIETLKIGKFGYKWYIGGLLGISETFFTSNPFKSFNVSPMVSYVNGEKGFAIHLAVPTINIQTNSINDINFGFNAGFSYHF